MAMAQLHNSPDGGNIRHNTAAIHGGQHTSTTAPHLVNTGRTGTSNNQQLPAYGYHGGHPYSSQERMSWSPQQYTQQPPSMAGNGAAGYTAPPPYNSPHVQHQHTPAGHQPPVVNTVDTQASSVFMVDSLLQSDSSHKPSSNFESPVVDEAEEDDEMSSYMAMASSLVTSSNDNS